MKPDTEAAIRSFLDPQAIPKMEGWCTVEKGLVLAELIVTRRPRLLCEIGIFGGKSMLAQGFALRETGDGVIFGIDPWDLEAALEGDIGVENKQWWESINLEFIYRSFVESVLRANLTVECRWIRCQSEAAASFFADGSIQMLHLDSNHSEIVSCRDVNTWLPKLSQNCTLVVDDSNWATQAEAMKRISEAGFSEQNHTTFSVFTR